MVDMGFAEEDITAAIEMNNFNFQHALISLLNGLDKHRNDNDKFQVKRFGRHLRQYSKHASSLPKISIEDLKDEARYPQREEQYRQRALDSFGIRVHIWDLGMTAGHTTNACFWLCLAAGLAECEENVLGQALPANDPLQEKLRQLRRPGELAACYAADIKRSTLGLLAEALRKHFCHGEGAVLLRSDMQQTFYPAFACLGGGDTATKAKYAKWVQRLATSEFADELVVVAVAREFSIRITVIPYTPQTSIRQWKIPSYAPSAAPQDGHRTIYLGNNDVHFVYLRSSNL